MSSHDKIRRIRISNRREVRRLKRQKRRKPFGEKKPSSLKTVTITAPRNFSFSENYHETVSCLRKYKQSAKALPNQRLFIDLSKITKLSLAGALVLAAEIDRFGQIRNRKVRPRNKMSWDPKVRRLLSSLGFFELFGLNTPTQGTHYEHIAVLPMISTDELDIEALNDMRIHMARVAEVLDQDLDVYEALVEAADNARKHAYPSDYGFEFTPIQRTWWATASWNPERGCVKFIVYDQGVGIPETLPRWENWEHVRGFIGNMFGPLSSGIMNDSSKLIRAAVEADRTSLGGGHGKGLQDMIGVLETCPGSSLRILSGRGSVLYEKDGSIKLNDHELHVGGTLVEWTIPTGKRISVVES